MGPNFFSSFFNLKIKLVFNFFIFFYAIIEIGHEKQITKTLNLTMTIAESQIFIALFIALGNGFLAFLLGNSLYLR